MTPQELYAALDARRLERGWPWWKVAIALEVSVERVRWMRRGVVSERLRARAEKWLGEAS